MDKVDYSGYVKIFKRIIEIMDPMDPHSEECIKCIHSFNALCDANLFLNNILDTTDSKVLSIYNTKVCELSKAYMDTNVELLDHFVTFIHYINSKMEYLTILKFTNYMKFDPQNIPYERFRDLVEMYITHYFIKDIKNIVLINYFMNDKELQFKIDSDLNNIVRFLP